ncbi:MAG: 30S ribosomal protein S17 [Planctomycetota bacterium]
MATYDRGTVRGVVVSDKMDKTIVVRIERLVLHPKYKKFVRSHTKYYAHDEENEAHVGDVVDISQTHPISKSKRWRLREVVQAAPEAVAFDREAGQ